MVVGVDPVGGVPVIGSVLTIGMDLGIGDTVICGIGAFRIGEGVTDIIRFLAITGFLITLLHISINPLL